MTLCTTFISAHFPPVFVRTHPYFTATIRLHVHVCFIISSVCSPTTTSISPEHPRPWNIQPSAWATSGTAIAIWDGSWRLLLQRGRCGGQERSVDNIAGCWTTCDVLVATPQSGKPSTTTAGQPDLRTFRCIAILPKRSDPNLIKPPALLF